MIGIGESYCNPIKLWTIMRYAFLRGLQVFGMIVIISGLTTGIRMRNMGIELSALVIGAGIFFTANLFLDKSN